MEQLESSMIEQREVAQLMEEFITEYNASPFDMYISYFDISTVGSLDKNSSDEEKDKTCLVVKLRDKLPEELVIPSVYNGVRVFVV